MAASASQAIQYFIPGGKDSIRDFKSMCNWYMTSYFPEIINDLEPRGVHLIPPLPRDIPLEPPNESSGGVKHSKISQKQFENFRTGQKSSIDEYNLVKTIQKYATENEIPMFVFHGFKIDPQKWRFIKSIADCELSKRNSWQDLEKCYGFDVKGHPKEIEIDVVTVDPTNGVIIWEVKSRNFESKASTSEKQKKLKAAAKQLQRDKIVVSWLSEHIAFLDEASLKVQKVAVLPDDRISAEDNEAFQDYRGDYEILDDSDLSNFGKFSQWFQSELKINDQPGLKLEAIYRSIVPVMVGLAATVITKQDNADVLVLDTSPNLEDVSSSHSVSRFDSEIDQEMLTRQEKPFADVLRTGKETVFRSSRGIKILFLTPQQQFVFDSCSSGLNILHGPAGSGKTILTIFKILELCSREPKEKILILCRGEYAWVYKKHLDQNRIKSEMALPTPDEGKRAIKAFADHFKKASSLKEDDPLTVNIEFEIDLVDLESQVLIGQTSDFLDAFYSNTNREFGKMKMKLYRNDREMRLKMKSDILWRQKTHIFIDDGDLADIVPNCSQMFTQADQKDFLTWVVLDHQQSSGIASPTLKNDPQYKKVNDILESDLTNVLKLDEVLRNSVEIHQFNCKLISQITKYHHVAQNSNSDQDNLPVTMPKQGSNFHGPLVTVYELYHQCMLEEFLIPKDTLEDSMKKTAEFIAFVFRKIVKTGVATEKLPVLSTEVSEFPRHLSNALKNTVGYESADLSHRFRKPDEYDNTTTAVVESSALTKSFEWERALVFATLPLPLSFQNRKILVNDVLRSSFVCLYQACTRPRSQLYIIAPGMYTELILKKIGVPEESVIVQKYEWNNSSSTFELNMNSKFSDDTVEKLHELSQKLH